MYSIIIILVVSLAQILCQGSITMALATMDVVLKDFNLQVSLQSVKVWYMGSFALTVGTFILISGKIGDLYGLKKFFIVGWFWVTITSLLCGLTFYTHLIIFLILSRSLQGIGFAFLLPCGMGILGNIFDNGFKKNLAFSCVGGAGPIGATLGGIFASIIAELSWWPWCFFIISILSCLLGVLSIFVMPDIKPTQLEPTKSETETYTPGKIEQLDILGSGFGITGLILLNFVLNQGPLIGWSTPYIIILLIISLILIIAFFIIEVKFALYPLLPSSILNLKIGLVLVSISLGWGSFGIWQFYYWIILMELRGYTAIITSLTYIPVMVLGTIASFIVAGTIHRFKPSIIMMGSSLGFLGGMIMLSIMPVNQTFWKLSFIQLFIITWGVDLSFAAGSIILSDHLPKSNQGMAGSLISTVVNYSLSFFLGLSSSVESGVFSNTGDKLGSYRASMYFGVGLAGLGLVNSIGYFIWQSRHENVEDCDKEGV